MTDGDALIAALVRELGARVMTEEECTMSFMDDPPATINGSNGNGNGAPRSESVKLGVMWKDKDGGGVSGSLEDGTRIRLKKGPKGDKETFVLVTVEGDNCGEFELKTPREGGTPYLDGYLGSQAARIFKNTKKFKPTSPDYTIKSRLEARAVAQRTVDPNDLPF